MARPNRRTRERLAAARRQTREDVHRARRTAAPAQGHRRHAMELTLPLPPDATPDEVRAALDAFAARVRELGLELGDVHVCTSPDCLHSHER